MNINNRQVIAESTKTIDLDNLNVKSVIKILMQSSKDSLILPSNICSFYSFNFRLLKFKIVYF